MKNNQFNNKLHEKLRNIKNHKPKEYWEILNPKKRKIESSINLNSLYEHFKELNNQPNSDDHNIIIDDILEEGDEILNNNFTTVELNKIIKKTKK